MTIKVETMKTCDDNGQPQFFCFGSNHKTAPISIRESFCIKPEAIIEALPMIKEKYQIPELAMLSTCNRCEIYGIYYPNSEDRSKLFKKIANVFFDIQTYNQDKSSTSSLLEKILNYSFLSEGDKAFKHIFYVASSLDSMIIGETQITSQFKQAFSISRQAKTLGPNLNLILNKALKTSKEIRSKTKIGCKTVSLGHAAIELIKRFFCDLNEIKLLVLGSGNMASLTTQYAVKEGIVNISILNRNIESAFGLLQRVGLGTVDDLSNLSKKITEADVVISATNAENYLLKREDILTNSRSRKKKPLLIIDLGLPRNIDPLCRKLENVYLYELDDLNKTINENISFRKNDSQEAQNIIAKSIPILKQKQRTNHQLATLSHFRSYLKKTYFVELKNSSKSIDKNSYSDTKKIELYAQRITNNFAQELKSLSIENQSMIQNFLKNISHKERRDHKWKTQFLG